MTHFAIGNDLEVILELFLRKLIFDQSNGSSRTLNIRADHFQILVKNQESRRRIDETGCSYFQLLAGTQPSVDDWSSILHVIMVLLARSFILTESLVLELNEIPAAIMPHLQSFASLTKLSLFGEAIPALMQHLQAPGADIVSTIFPSLEDLTLDVKFYVYFDDVLSFIRSRRAHTPLKLIRFDSKSQRLSEINSLIMKLEDLGVDVDHF